MTSETALERPTGRQLPPPKPKQRGYHPPTQQQGADDVVQPMPASSPASLRPQAPADAVASARVTIYSDARIEHWLNEVRVQSAIARLDLTHSAIWRRAMYDLMSRFTPEQIVREFQFQRDRGATARPGRPRR